MNSMFRPRNLLKISLVGLAALTVVALSVAQPLGVADRVLLIQAKRFEGSFKLPSGAMNLKVGDATADWDVASGSVKLSAAIAPESGKPSRATLSVDGRTVVGKATIEGKTLTLEFVDGKVVYRVKLTLSGRNEGDLSVTKDDASLVSGAIKRA